MHFRSRLRDLFRPLFLLVVTLVQLPLVWWACWHTRTPLPALFAFAVSFPYARQLREPWSPVKPGPVTYLALGWWVTSLVFALLMLPAAFAVRAGVPWGWAWGAVGAVALVFGVDAVLGPLRVRRITVRVRDLPPALEGYRIGQLSDIHCGPHVPEARVRRWVERLNRQRVDLAAVTGDLIAHGSSHVEAVARALGGLRATHGAFVSMGNHDYFTDGEHFVRTLRHHGLAVLRNEGTLLTHGDARLYVAGVDDTWTGRDDVARALEKRPPDVPAVLLAHDPDLFPEAERHGADLVLAGHTHGGQLAVPGLRQVSLARALTYWTAGLYRRGRSWLYVNRGAGTTGPPVRLGAPPEMAVLTLRRE